ncbi:hypothetical protein KI387_002907, partial [Taxus chinensis]
ASMATVVALSTLLKTPPGRATENKLRAMAAVMLLATGTALTGGGGYGQGAEYTSGNNG